MSTSHYLIVVRALVNRQYDTRDLAAWAADSSDTKWDHMIESREIDSRASSLLSSGDSHVSFLSLAYFDEASLRFLSMLDHPRRS